MMQKKNVSTVLRAFIDGYIKKHNDILEHDRTHCDLYVETDDGKREWISVLKEEVEKDYSYDDSEKVYKKKGEKFETQ
jgi:ferredoxin-thioredoxin reductase catalytic subunit